MDLFSDLRQALLTLPAVTALVGGTGPGARIWNSWPRTYSVPCVVMDIDTEEEANDLTGTSDAELSSVTITCRAETEASSHSLQEAVRSGLKAYEGTFSVLCLNDTSRVATPKSDGSTGHFYDNIMDYSMAWAEAM